MQINLQENKFRTGLVTGLATRLTCSKVASLVMEKPTNFPEGMRCVEDRFVKLRNAPPTSNREAYHPKLFFMRV
jgi:hypothetical protein